MSLTLTTLRCPETIPPQTRRVGPGEFSIGRGLDNDWVLPDPNRHLSKRHCTLTWRGDSWLLSDTSTNGTFVNADDRPVGNAAPRPLNDGDRLRLGLYELEVRIDAEQPHGARPAQSDDAGEDRTRMFRPLQDAPVPPPLLPAELYPDTLDTNSPFAEPHRPAHNAAAVEIPEDWDLDPFVTLPEAAPGGGLVPPPPPPLAPPALPDLLAAFLRGAGMKPAMPADAEATMEAMGAAFRAVVTGVRQVLLARASIKSEFRIEQTMIRARGNNPLKFSVSDDDALASLLGVGRRTDMPAAEAVTDALRDMQLHELASMAAMQAAVRALVAQFDPEKIRAGSEQGGMALVPAQRKARAWEAFEALHARTTQALADDFDSVFGKAFAMAYEQTLHEASERTEPV
jgi:type VI secretion system protein ImpI/type VI secretion system protein